MCACVWGLRARMYVRMCVCGGGEGGAGGSSYTVNNLIKACLLRSLASLFLSNKVVKIIIFLRTHSRPKSKSSLLFLLSLFISSSTHSTSLLLDDDEDVFRRCGDGIPFKLPMP